MERHCWDNENQTRDCDKIFVYHVFDKGVFFFFFFSPGYEKNSSNLIIGKKNPQLKKWAKDLNALFFKTKKTYEWQINSWKDVQHGKSLGYPNWKHNETVLPIKQSG